MEPDKSRFMYPKIHDEEWLREKYIQQDMTAKMISEEVGCAHGTVRDYLSEFGISKIDQMPPELSEPEWLREQYVDQKKSDSEIADMLDVSSSTIQSTRDKYNISKEPKYPKLRDEEWLKAKWEEELLSVEEIGKLAGGARSRTVRKWLIKYKII